MTTPAAQSLPANSIGLFGTTSSTLADIAPALSVFLTIPAIVELARRRRARGLRLNVPEAIEAGRSRARCGRGFRRRDTAGRGA